MISSTLTEDLTTNFFTYTVNHPLNILKQLLKVTSERLSNLSCNDDEFIKASGEYQNVLKNSGLEDKLIYTPRKQCKRRQRNRKVIWYKPPFDPQVKTNIGKTFLRLFDRNFPPHHGLHEIINRNTVKIVTRVCLTWHHTFLFIIKASHKNLRKHNI